MERAAEGLANRAAGTVTADRIARLDDLGLTLVASIRERCDRRRDLYVELRQVLAVIDGLVRERDEALAEIGRLRSASRH